MEEPEYIIYSLRSGGFMSKVANYTSDWKDAKILPHSEAIDICHIQNKGGKAQLLPIDLDDLKATHD